jgi:putative flippase GtrA
MNLTSEIHVKMVGLFVVGFILGLFLCLFSLLSFFDFVWGNEIISFIIFIVMMAIVEYFVKETSDKIAKLEDELIKAKKQ